MLSNMLRTLGIRVFTALLSLLIIVIGGQMLGAEILGQVSLLIVSVTIINLVGGFAGNGALVFLIPRNEGKALLPVSQMWALGSGILTTAVLFLSNAFPKELVLHVFALGVIGSLNQNFMSVLLAAQRIKAHNFLTLIQSMLMIGVLLIVIFLFNEQSIYSWVTAMYASYLPVLTACLFLLPGNKLNMQGINIQSFRILFGYGSLVQLSSILALLTYRLTYYYTEAWLGLAALGILSVAAQISEAVWILPKSIALVQFSKITNLKKLEDSAQLTYFLGVVTFLFTMAALAILVLLPDSLYLWIFGKDFTHMSPVVRVFAPGIMAISLNIILSHFFSGSGHIIYNLIGSAIGLATVAAAGWMLISGGNLNDAALVSTLGYIANFLFAAIAFLRINRHIKLSFRSGYMIFAGSQKN